MFARCGAIIRSSVATNKKEFFLKDNKTKTVLSDFTLFNRETEISRSLAGVEIFTLK